MTAAEIVEALRAKLTMPGGRHLYGVLGTYQELEQFQKVLAEAKTADGQKLPKPRNVNRAILEEIPDDEFQTLVRNEAKRPEPTAKHVEQAFERFLRGKLRGKGLIVLTDLELLFAYGLELNLLRTMAADDDRVLLLLPGKRDAGRVVMFPDWPDGGYMLPTNLIAENHLWELRG
jgi:hypothetical protein